MGDVLTGHGDPTPARIGATVLDAAPRCVLAESPRFAGDRWWWVDATVGAVFSATATDGGWKVRRGGFPGERVSLVHPAGPGWMVVARERRLQYLAARDSAGPAFGDLELDPEWLFNDGTADAVGGLWIGVLHRDRSPESGFLLHLDAVGAVTDRIDGFSLSNGLAYDISGEFLFHADSLRRVVLRHRIAPNGRVVDSSVHLSFAAEDGMPDGLATDLDGGLWVACYGAGQVRRFDSAGRLSLVVDVPTPQVTSVSLGGDDGSDLLITTAREGYDEARSAAEPLAGRLFVARAPHAATPVFSVHPPGTELADGPSSWTI
jgi:xylono-1,5-lactonase